MTDTPKIDMAKVKAKMKVVGSFLAIGIKWLFKHLKRYFAATLYRNMEEPAWLFVPAVVSAFLTMIYAATAANTPTFGKCTFVVGAITATSVLFGPYIFTFLEWLFECVSDGISNIKNWAAQNRYDND